MSFYRIDCHEPDAWECAALLNHTPRPNDERWDDGKPFTYKVEEPIEITIDSPDYDSELEFPPDCDRLLEFESVDALIMTRRLLAAIQEAGVDNLEVYEAVIRNPESGFENNDYVACKLIGQIWTADMRAAGDDIDTLKANGHLMSRWAEHDERIVVHRSVGQHILDQGIDTLTFHKIEL